MRFLNHKILLLILAIWSNFICLSSYPIEKKRVAIIQIVDHPSLNLVRDSTIEYLEQKYPKDELVITSDSAQGKISLVSQIAKKRVSENPDIIVAISTPAAQAVKASDQRKQIPLVFSAVADPLGAKLIANTEKPSGFITGVTDNQPLEDQALLIRELFPQLKKIGFLYNSGEINSVKIIERMHRLLADIDQLDVTISNSGMIKTAVDKMVGSGVELIYVPLDNTVVSGFNSVIKLTKKHNIPVITTDPDLVAKGAIACVGNGYKDVGLLTGEIVNRILKGESIKNIPVRSPDAPKLFLNVKMLKEFGIEIPKSLVEKCINC